MCDPARVVHPPDRSTYFSDILPDEPLLCWPTNGGNALVIAASNGGDAQGYLHASFSYVYKGDLSGWRPLFGFTYTGSLSHRIAHGIRKYLQGNDEEDRQSRDDIADGSLCWRFTDSSESTIELRNSSYYQPQDKSILFAALSPPSLNNP